MGIFYGYWSFSETPPFLCKRRVCGLTLKLRNSRKCPRLLERRELSWWRRQVDRISTSLPSTRMLCDRCQHLKVTIRNHFHREGHSLSPNYLFNNQILVLQKIQDLNETFGKLMKYLYVNGKFVRPLRRLVHCGRPTGRRWRPPGQFLQVSLSGHNLEVEINGKQISLWDQRVKI